MSKSAANEIQELAQRYTEAHRNYNRVSARQQQLMREKARTQITMAEITELTPKSQYKAVGKMFLSVDLPTLKKELSNDLGNIERDLETASKNREFLQSQLTKMQMELMQLERSTRK